MRSSVTEEYAVGGSSLRRYTSVAALLVGLLLITWAGRWGYAAYVQATVQAQKEKAVGEAFRYIQHDFQSLQQVMLERARKLADAPAIVPGLRAYVTGRRPTVPEPLVEYFASLNVEDRWSVELYDPIPRLIAWHGFSMPLDRGPNAPNFLQTPQTAVASDGMQRQVLAVWYPIHANGQVLGTLRIMRILNAQVPVENQYLENYSLTEAWQQATGLPVQVQYGVSAREVTWQGPTRPLRGLDGSTLGHVAVEVPSAQGLVSEAKSRFDDVLAFWGTLLLFWLLAGLWHWYRFTSPPFTSSVHRQLSLAATRFGVVAVTWWGIRYVLLALDVPARWQPPGTPLAPLFDPAHMAFTFGNGLMRSAGDFFITALFSFLFGLAFLNLARRFRQKGFALYRLRNRLPDAGPVPSALRFFSIPALLGLISLGLVTLLILLTRHALLNSTLDYFARESLIPDPLVLVVFCTLLLLTVTAMALIVGLGWISLWLLARYRPSGWSPAALVGGALLAAAAPLLVAYFLLGLQPLQGGLVVSIFLATGLLLALSGFTHRRNDLHLLTLRNILLVLFLHTVLLYPLLDMGIDRQRRTHMVYAAETFSEGQDPRVIFAIKQVLNKTQDQMPITSSQRRIPAFSDSLATELLRGSLLSSLSLYDVSLTVLDTTGAPLARSYQAAPRPGRNQLNRVDSMEFSVLGQMYREANASGALVERITGRRERDHFQYIGIIPLRTEPNAPVVRWAMVRAEPQTLLRGGGMPFPRVLLPAGLYGNPYTNLSLAEFQRGMLVRSFGQDFGRYRLNPVVERKLLSQREVWRTEQIEERRFLTYYQRYNQANDASLVPPLAAAKGLSVVAVRVPAINLFDHLYYLLRLTVASLLIGVLGYLTGLYLRWHAGLLPAGRLRFHDKILNAFLGVGLVTVAAVGFVGLQVVRGENERAIQSWLRQYLERVERTLVLETVGNEMPYRVLDRMRIDSLSSRVGLDLNLYTAERLVASSRPQLMREDLIDERLPIEAVQALYYDGYRFTYTEEKVGSFTYTTGFRTLLDEQGQPRYVVAVPTLPEQERIAEERARTIAYLFGALLLLVLVVMVTASFIARALTRPLLQLRKGLEAVARGRFERPLPVSTRDEIGELVETFNDMQKQLAESRRKLARQEREMAWREMARQVAHEIKNPLTPMKLSLQHLRRAYQRLDWPAQEEDGPQRFQNLFERITSTLIEQINTLARIANEFHSFARMPSRMPERLDLNAVIREAVSLMQEEAGAQIEENLHSEPLSIEADREELRRIYINLLKNAIQAIPETRVGRVEVTTDCKKENGTAWAISTVSDNGSGILPDVREKIFQPNFSTKTSGTGLGLAIIQKGVTDLNGEIDFKTKEGTGTTFRLRLPLAKE